MEFQRGVCPECKKREIHAKGLCNACYRRLTWRRKLKKCKSCGRIRPHQAFGLCAGCHSRLHHYDKIKASNAKRLYGIDLETMREITKKCVACGFNKIVELHHLDGLKANAKDDNLIGLCPNCHRQIHSYTFFEDITKILAGKGYDVSQVHPTNHAKNRPQKERHIRPQPKLTDFK